MTIEHDRRIKLLTEILSALNAVRQISILEEGGWKQGLVLRTDRAELNYLTSRLDTLIADLYLEESALDLLQEVLVLHDERDGPNLPHDWVFRARRLVGSS